MMQLTFDFSAPLAPPPKPRKALTPKQQRAADAAAEQACTNAYWASQRERERLEARDYWRVGMVVSMPLWAKVLDTSRTYTQMLPGVVEAIEGDLAQVRIYAAPEYGTWMESYPLHRKLAVDVPLVELGRYALNQHLVRIVAEGKLATGDAEVAKAVREWHAGGFTTKKP